MSGIDVISTPFFKLKKDKNFQIIDLQKQFNFKPDRIIVERLSSRNNVIRINAVLTEEYKKRRAEAEAKVIGKRK